MPLLEVESPIDLEGNAGSERLTADDHKLVLSNGYPEKRRQWRWSDLDGFRLESSFGSCFLQAQMRGQWIDILRRPAGADHELTDALEWLNARCCRTHGGETDGGPPAPEEAARAQGRPGNHRASTCPRRWRTATLLLALLRPFRGSVLLLLALSLGAVTIEVIPPMLQGRLVDHVLKPGTAVNPKAELLVLLGSIVVGLLLVRLAAAVLSMWKGYVSSRIGTSMTANLRNGLVQKLSELPLSFYDRNQVGILMSQVAYDTETLHTLVYHATSGVFLQSLQLAGIGVMLLYLNARLALVTLLPMPLIIAGSWYFARCLQPRHHHYWEAVGKQAASLMGMLSGIRVVKAFVQEDREARRFDESSRRLRDSRLTVDSTTSIFAAAMGFLFAIGTLAAWYLGGRDVLFGQMTLGALTAFLQYLAMFYTPLTSITESTTWFATFFSVSRRIADLLDTPGESEPAASPAAIDHIRGRVELSDVSFSYEKNRPVLSNISFTIEPGEMVGVVGRSGSGKSTLVSLIGRLYDVEHGTIRIDGVDIRQIDPRQLRRQIGMVPQDPFLFRGPVADNIAYGDAEAPPERILLAAKQADAHDFIMRMPLAYSTQLGEGGSGLSGGERQRISIARALLFDPAMLILDEATASVDAESERAICRAIRRWADRRTAIVIAHRLSTLQDADRLLVFDQGRLVEAGTQRELLSREGLYRSLLRLQGNSQDARRYEAPAGGDDAVDRGDAMDCVASEHGFPFHAMSPGDFDPDGRPRKEQRGEGNGLELRWLDPGATSIADDGQGLLRVKVGGEDVENVFAVRALPAMFEDQYISLRRREPAGREVELGLIVALDTWPQVEREVVRRSLGRRYLLRRIGEIRQFRASGNHLTMAVMTDSGPATLRLEKPGEGSQPFGRNGMLLSDVNSSYFIIADRGSLPKWQQRLLALYFGD